MVGIIGTVVSIVGVDMIPFPDKKYNIIYADPAWNYTDKSLNRGGAARHYKTMTDDEIQNLQVQKIAAENCILFLWATFPKIQEALDVIEHWGFEYKTMGFTWIKKNKKSINTNFWGMGRWTRSNAEICLLATKGKPKRLNAGVHSVIETPIQRHSKKPDIVRDKIIQLVGDLPRIELFARETADGWDSWGNEIESS
jgi:N6-adenosine-specific RNA methylase IME4